MSYLNSNEDIHVFDEIKALPFEPGQAKLDMIVEAPKFSIPKLSKVRNQIYEQLLSNSFQFDEDVLTKDTCEKITDVVCRTINYPSTKRKTVLDTISKVFFNKDMSNRRLYQISTKISGNIDIIQDDKVIPLWEEIDVPIWVPVEIVAQEETYGASPGKEIKAYITAGVPASMTMIQRVSNKFIQYMLREIGYPRYKRFDAQEIYNTRFTCNLTKIAGKTKMVAFSVSHSQKNHNKALYKIRHEACPDPRLTCECTQCLKGLTDCPGGLHATTYFVGDCNNGHRGIMKEGNKKCNGCIEHAKLEAAKRLFERRRQKYE